MKVSVIICTYQSDRYQYLSEALDSIDKQIHPVETVVVVDGNPSLYDFLSQTLKNKTIVYNPDNPGLAASRNLGVRAATGDIVAFMDDDAVADECWIGELVKMYVDPGVIALGGNYTIAAGGKVLPDWMDHEARFMPEEYLWLVGATHKGFPENVTAVRNTFGSNLSFMRNVFLSLNGFDTELGFNGNVVLQGEEAELCTRMLYKYGKKVIYNPGAIVYHKVFGNRTDIMVLLRRSFYQGYSKRILAEGASRNDMLSEESAFLHSLIFNRIPGRIKDMVLRPSMDKINQFICLNLFTVTIGLGYLYRIGIKIWDMPLIDIVRRPPTVSRG